MKKVVLFIISGILLLAIPLAVYLVGKNTELRKRAAPATTISLIPSQITKQVNETFSLEVKIDTADNQVATIQLQIIFDPAKLQAVNITNGALAPTIRVSGKVDETGKASITVGAQDATHPITGTGTVAVLTMKALAPSTAPVSVRFSPAPDTFINALGEGENNVLVGSTGASITIQNTAGTTVLTNNLSASQGTVATESGTPIPTPTETIQANASSSGNLRIISPTSNGDVATDLPTFTGTASPGATIILTIHSTEYPPVTVTADADGNWTYTPTAPLEPGQHTVTALTTDPSTGATQTTSDSFVVASGNESIEPSSGSAVAASGSAVPETGSIETTFILITIGLLIFLGGAALPMFTR